MDDRVYGHRMSDREARLFLLLEEIATEEKVEQAYEHLLAIGSKEEPNG